MTKNMLEILKSINNTHGQLVNNLIKSNVLTVKDIVNTAIESKDASIIFSIVNYVNGLNSEEIEKLADAIIATKETKYIYYFACDIKGTLIEKLADAIIATKDAVYIYHFARDIKGVPIEKLADAIITTNDAEYIYYFACDVKGAPIEKLAEAIIAIGNVKYVILFVKNVSVIPEEYKNMMYMVLERERKIEEDEKRMSKLIELAASGDLKTLKSDASVYRSLLMDEEYINQEKLRTKVRKTGSK